MDGSIYLFLRFGNCRTPVSYTHLDVYKRQASLTDFTALVSRNEKLTYAFEHRNAIYGQRYPKNFRPEHICYLSLIHI